MNDLYDGTKAPREPMLYLGVKQATCPTHKHGGCACCADVRPLSEVRAMSDEALISLLRGRCLDPLTDELVRRLDRHAIRDEHKRRYHAFNDWV